MLSGLSRPWIELARLNKPTGALLMIWPYVWGLAMAAFSVSLPVLPFVKLLSVGSAWFLFVRSKYKTIVNASIQTVLAIVGAGCIWNDIMDRDIDKKVERTKHRPLATGRISVRGALVFLFLHLVPLSFVLMLGNNQVRLIGFLTLYPLAGLYPFMKRITYWPQAWLGIAFNTGTLMSWALVTGAIPCTAYALALATWCWTMWYDTVYGSQDKKDDIKIGIKSTALLFASLDSTRIFLAAQAILFISGLAFAGYLNNQGLSFFVISIAFPAVNLAVSLWNLDLSSPKACAAVFNESGYRLGPAVTLGLLVNYLFQKLF